MSLWRWIALLGAVFSLLGGPVPDRARGDSPLISAQQPERGSAAVQDERPGVGAHKTVEFGPCSFEGATRLLPVRRSFEHVVTHGDSWQRVHAWAPETTLQRERGPPALGIGSSAVHQLAA